MFTILVVLIIILSILLTLVVLSQAAKGNGLAGGLGAPGSVGTMFGVRRASDFLMKATIIIAGAFMLFTIVVNRFFLSSRMLSEKALLRRFHNRLCRAVRNRLRLIRHSQPQLNKL
jgi:protein translocase SecG subunit